MELLKLRQSAGVKGRLKCNGKPAKGVKVILVESEIRLDVFMAHNETDKNGNFKLSGWADEITSIDPELNIYSKCNYENPPEEIGTETKCYKKFTIQVPSDYIARGTSRVDRYFDIGVKELSEMKGEKIKCIHRSQRRFHNFNFAL
ncbi:Transthyretin-like family protein [Ancylostoma duodenale]|uniref:Transthyretin-like family protein n=1 Tax=Ancylostoma duodenale TaxID=51022 RepID=A0A0C2GDT9_9BILA|nr:Transthyretin-like family protein [Ancylostoma duodenale]